MHEVRSFLKIFRLFDKRQKINAVILLCMTVVGAAAETLSIGVILPFMYLILNPGMIRQYDILQRILELQAVGSYSRFVIVMCAALALIFVLKSLYMFCLIYFQNRLSYNRQVAISKKVFRSYLMMPYSFFFNRNSAELQRNVNVLVPNAVTGVFLSGLTLITELLIIIFITIFLFLVSSISATIIVFALGGICFSFYKRLRKIVDRNAKSENKYGFHMVKSVNEGFASIKEIKVLGREAYFIDEYERYSKEFAHSKAVNNLLNQTPRLLIELVTVLGVIAIVVVNIMADKEITEIIPTLAIFGMAAFRVMPSMNRVLSNLTSIRYNGNHLDAFYEDLKTAGETSGDQPKEEKRKEGEPFRFGEKIELKQVSFRYPNTEEDVLTNVDMVIDKGRSIGIVGPSGAGKTTLIDLILGLLEPTSGKLMLDSTDSADVLAEWRKDVGYVPQNIWLTDDSIACNVAFGIAGDEVDANKLWKALEIAQIKEFIESLPDGIETRVGEKGIKLSGGQKQRIAIARALYHDPEVLVFDEATSSLDTDVEKTISEAIGTIGKTKTMIIIAHRVNTLDACDEIYEVKGKSVVLKERRDHDVR